MAWDRGRKHHLTKNHVAVEKHRKKMRAWVAELKSHPCIDCGHLFPKECMEFDHVRGVKKFNLADACVHSKADVEIEKLKCDLVCANCHRIRTVLRRRRK